MENKIKICCIGHITKDRVVTPQFEAYMAGGTAYYFAKALRRFADANFKLFTSLGEEDMGVVDELRGEGIQVDVEPSNHTVFFENKYGEDINQRTQRVLAKADPFTKEMLENVDADIYHLGTLLADDFDLATIKRLSEKGKVSLDIQGFLRKVEGQDVVHIDYADKREAMPFIHFLKANEKEMEVLTGVQDPYKAARILSDWGCKEVILTLGDKGSIIYADGRYYDIPAIVPSQLVDATGCGDTYMAGYLYMREKCAEIPQAGIFAAAMCTLKLQNKGPLDATVQEVLEKIDN